MEYDLYHDESQEEGYWHGVLFIPEKWIDEIVGFLKTIRKLNGYKNNQKLQFKNLKGKGKKFRAILMSLQLFELILRRSIKSHIRDNSIYCPRTKKEGIDCQIVLSVKKVYDIKFRLLKIKNAHKDMENYRDHASKIETTFRFALKGGCHFVFNRDNPICVKKVIFDGYKHYQRSIDEKRIVKNLPSEFREYCTIHKDFSVDDRQIEDRKDDSFILMNFIDNIVGAWRCLISKKYNKYEKEVIGPLRGLFDRWQEGKIIQNPNSRWLRCFSLSECSLEENKLMSGEKEWEFNNDFEIYDKKQPKLL